MALSTPIVQLSVCDPVSIEVTQKISDAVRLLSGSRFHHLPVVDKGRLVGMLSTVDILRLNVDALQKDVPATLAALDRHYSVGDVMVTDVIPLSERATVGDAAKLLAAGGFHALPIMGSDGKLVGIVTTTDLMAHLLEAPATAEVPDSVRRRTRMLEQVYEAAQNYLASGQSITAHEHLERTLEEARRNAA